MSFSRKQQQVLGLVSCVFAVWALSIVYADTHQGLDVQHLTESDPPDLLFYVDTPIDINLANMEELQLLPDIGPILAGRIIDYRQKYGKFSTSTSLEQVKGIGPKTVQKIHYYLIFPE